MPSRRDDKYEGRHDERRVAHAVVRDQQSIDAAHAPKASVEAWLNLGPGERSTVQEPEAVQAAAQRWAIFHQSPDYQDHVLGQAQANNPQAKDQLVKDWMAAGSPVRPFDPEFLAAQKRFAGREPARAATRELGAEQRRQEFLSRQGRTPEQALSQVNTASSTEARKRRRGYKAVATAKFARADQAKDESAREKLSGPSHAEEEWYRDEFLARHPEAIDAEVKTDTAARAKGPATNEPGT